MPTKLPPASNSAAAEGYAMLSFEELKVQFNACACEKNAHVVATWMFKADPEKALTLLPLNFDPRNTANAAITARLDFDHQNGTTTHEWAAALVAAKTLKLQAGIALDVGKTDQAIDEAGKIYARVIKDGAGCNIR